MPGWRVFGESYEDTRRLAEEGVRFYLDCDAEERSDPAPAAYPLVAAIIRQGSDRRAYSRAVRILKRARSVAQAAGELDAFAANEGSRRGSSCAVRDGVAGRTAFGRLPVFRTTGPLAG
jgi:hypothetical protein